MCAPLGSRIGNENGIVLDVNFRRVVAVLWIDHSPQMPPGVAVVNGMPELDAEPRTMSQRRSGQIQVAVRRRCDRCVDQRPLAKDWRHRLCVVIWQDHGIPVHGRMIGKQRLGCFAILLLRRHSTRGQHDS